MRSVGIDIGHYSVKVAEVESTSKSYAIKQFYEFKLNQDPTRDNDIEILDILRRVAANYDPQHTRFIFAISQEHVSSRILNFPFKERHKILKSIGFELEDELPFSQKDAIFEAKITRFLGPTAEVLALACPKEHIEGVLQTAADATIDPEIVSVEGLAFANLFEQWRESPPQESAPEEIGEEDEDTRKPAQRQPDTDQEGQDHTTGDTAQKAEVVLNIGHKKTLLLVIRNGCVQTVRHIDWGGWNVAQAIASKYSLHYVEALKETEKKAFILLNQEGATKEQIAFSDVIRKTVDELAHEIRLTLIELETDLNLRFHRAVMVGGACQIRNLGPYLTQKIQLPTNRLKHLANYPQVDFTASPHNEVASTIAIGLAIEGVKRPKNPPVNLLKGEFARKNQTFKLFWDKWGYTVQLVAAAFFVLLFYASFKDSLSQKAANEAFSTMKDQAKAVAGLTGRGTTHSGVRKYLANQKRIEKSWAVGEKVLKINSALDILKGIALSTPASSSLGLDVKFFSVVNSQVQIQGQVAGKKALQTFENVLKGVATSNKIQPRDPTIKVDKNKVGFHYVFNVDRFEGS